MNSQEQAHVLEDGMRKMSKGKEGLQPVIQAIKEVAERFNNLETEAETYLIKKDLVNQEKKLRERANLIVNLPNHLAGLLEGIDLETKKEILYQISSFAASAQEALDKGGFYLFVLLMPKGSQAGDNDLNKFIEYLEKK